MSDPRRPYHSPRREREALRTRQEILQAARELFTTRGYAQVTMSDIARAAGTAVKTVYASVGTKAGILHTLITSSMAESRATETNEQLSAAASLEACIALVARGTRADNEQFHSLIELLESAMAGDDDARATYRQMIDGYRGALRDSAAHMVAKGFSAKELAVDDVADRLWLCFGLAAWRTLTIDCGWTYDDAERTLGRQAVSLLTEL